MSSPDMIGLVDRLRKIVKVQLGVEDEKIVSDASFLGDLGADSLDLVELIMSLEEEFDVEIPDEDAENILTVGDALRYLEAHGKA